MMDLVERVEYEMSRPSMANAKYLLEQCKSEIERLRAENVALLEALEGIAAVGYGLQGIQEDYPDANAYNYHAMKYWATEHQRLQAIARAAIARYKGEM